MSLIAGGLSAVSHFVSRAGARLGNWNDRHLRYLDSLREAPRWRRLIDRIAGWLYKKGDPR